MELLSVVGTAVISSIVGPMLLKWWNDRLEKKRRKQMVVLKS